MTQNVKTQAATLDLINYALKKADLYKREAENVTEVIKHFKELLKIDSQNFKYGSQHLEKAATMAQKKIDELVRKGMRVRTYKQNVFFIIIIIYFQILRLHMVLFKLEMIQANTKLFFTLKKLYK
jgi:hypothetical protein